MVRMTIAPFHHVDSLVASVAGAGTALSIAAQPDASQPTQMVALLSTILGPALVVVVNRFFAARAARKRAEALVLKDEAEEALTNSDPTDDAQGRKKLLQAKILEAEANALEDRKDVQ